MRVLLFLTALGLVHGQWGDNYAAPTAYTAPAVADADTAATYPTWTGTPTWTNRDTARGARSGAASSAGTPGVTGFAAALDRLAEILKTNLDTAKANLATTEENYDKDKCTYEKIIKAQAATATDEKRRLDEATSEFDRFDKATAAAKGEQAAAQVGVQNIRQPISKACNDWVNYVCADATNSGTESLRVQLNENVNNAAILYAALSKLIDARPEFNFGATLGFMQLSNEQIGQIEVSEDEVASLSKIPGLTAMVQGQVAEKLKGYGGGGAGVVGTIKGVYEATVTRAQDLVEAMNKHGIAGAADQLAGYTKQQCMNLGLGEDGAACPDAATAFSSTDWTSFTPVGTDFYSDLLRTQLLQFRTAYRKYEMATTKYNDASTQRIKWKSTETSAKFAYDTAVETKANAELDLQQCRLTYDTSSGDSRDLIQGLNTALETLTDPSVVQRMSGDAVAGAFVQVSMHKMQVGLHTQASLAAQQSGFTGVITAIGEMISKLQNQIMDEAQRKEQCTRDETSASQTKTDLDTEVAQLETNLQQMATSITSYEDNVKIAEDHIADLEKTFNEDMHMAQTQSELAQKEKDEAALNERTYQRILGVLSNIRLPAAAQTEILCDSVADSANCDNDGVLIMLLKEVQTIQQNESKNLEVITKHANNKRDTYTEAMRLAKVALAENSMSLAHVREEHRTTDQQLVHANAAANSAESYHNDIKAACDGLTSGVQAKTGEWEKEIGALRQIIKMLNDGIQE